MVDRLLDELASLSGYSNLQNNFARSCRTRTAILRDLYRSLDPVEAKFMTQIILKDLRPVLYPLAETHTTKALLHYKSNATYMLTKWDVMGAWHPSMCKIYRVRSSLDETAEYVDALSSIQQENPPCDAFSPVLGIPIEVLTKKS
jgi:DNA ligase-4